MNLKSAFLFLPLLILGFVLGYLLLQKTYPTVVNIQSKQQVNDSAKDFPFQELTIPYLRERKYSSTLGDLKKYKASANYTSYLTSYDSDGLKINGLITIPNDDKTKKHPAIVFVHGYIAPSIYRTTEKYVEYVDYLARNGYVVFKIDLRGHGESDGEATGSYYSGDYVIDTINAYNALENTSFVDPNKIGLWGHSMAGNVTLRAFAAKPQIPAVAIWAGAGFTYSDLLEYRISDNSYRPPAQSTDRQKRREELRKLYGDFDPNDAFWKKVAPSNYLSDLVGAISLFHAADDTVVSVEYSRNIKKLLDEAGIKNEYYEYRGGGHNITNPNFSQAMQTTVEFFDKYLKN